MLNATISLAVNIILNILLIPKFGIVGAATSVAVALITNHTISVIQTYKLLNIQPYKKVYIKMLFCGAILFIPLFYIKETIKPSLTLFIFMLAVTYCLYFVLILFSRSLEKTDKYIISSVEKRFKIKIKIDRFIK